MKAWGVLSVTVAALVVAGGVAAERIGSRAPADAPPGEAPSWIWTCPHGGGHRWKATVALANPGAQAVRARVTTLSADAAGDGRMVTVPAGEELLLSVPANVRERATFVEAFGGWLAVGWLVDAADPDRGVSAEPCTPEATDLWFTPGSSTDEGEELFLVIANPFAADAVFDVTLFSPDRPPLRDPDWTDLVLEGRRSVALPVSKKILGEAAVSAMVETKVGRVAVSTLGVTREGGVRGVLGATAPGTTSSLPAGGGTGQSTLVTFVPGESSLRYGVTRVSEDGPEAVGNLVDAQQAGASTATAPVVTTGPTTIVVATRGDGSLVGGQRATGPSADDAATGGLPPAAVAWVVLPTVWEEPSFPGLVVTNPGSEAVTVTLRLLPPGGGASRSVSFDVGPSASASASKAFLGASPQAAVLVTATGPVLAAGASTSSGIRGLSRYAVAGGVPVPDDLVASA
jgi:hypothetical protein